MKTMLKSQFLAHHLLALPCCSSSSSSFCRCFSSSSVRPQNQQNAKEIVDGTDGRKQKSKTDGQRTILTEKPKPNTALSKWEQLLKLFGLRTVRNPPLTNMGYADRKGGFHPIDIEMPAEVLAKEFPKWMLKETKALKKEIKERYVPHIPYEYVDQFTEKFVAHGESFVEYEFKTDEDFEKWKTGCDSEWSEGYSKCELYRSDRGTAIFEGTLSTRLVMDGRTERAGWCSMRSINDTWAFGRKKRLYHWDDNNFTHLLIKCRGDGRSYKMMLHCPQYWDFTWGDSYSYPLHTHGGPYWQYELIPFSRFIHTVNGRIMDLQFPVILASINSIGVTLMDRIDGPFRLEIGFIGATKHTSHHEEFAYEKYNIPLGHPEM